MSIDNHMWDDAIYTHKSVYQKNKIKSLMNIRNFVVVIICINKLIFNIKEFWFILHLPSYANKE